MPLSAQGLLRCMLIVPFHLSLPQPFLLHLLLDTARGMAYVHSRGICHGDLKACNVLVASDPGSPYGCCAKVSDFGLSRALALGASHLSTRTYSTVTHMAPELLASGHLRQASDVYSFGIMGGGAGGMWVLPACPTAYDWHKGAALVGAMSSIKHHHAFLHMAGFVPSGHQTICMLLTTIAIAPPHSVRGAHR